jgi:hypothetical protein
MNVVSQCKHKIMRLLVHHKSWSLSGVGSASFLTGIVPASVWRASHILYIYVCVYDYKHFQFGVCLCHEVFVCEK